MYLILRGEKCLLLLPAHSSIVHWTRQWTGRQVPEKLSSVSRFLRNLEETTELPHNSASLPIRRINPSLYLLMNIERIN